MNHRIKHNRAKRIANKLPMAEQEIWENIPDFLKERLTGKELAEVMNAMDKSYHNGRASTGAELIDASREDGAVYVNGIGIIEWREIGAKYKRIEEPSYTTEGTYCGVRSYSKKIEDGKLQLVLK